MPDPDTRMSKIYDNGSFSCESAYFDTAGLITCLLAALCPDLPATRWRRILRRHFPQSVR